MALEGSPKKFAEDVAAGLHSINAATLKRYSLVEVKKIQVGLMTVQKELRTLVVDAGDFNALKDKGMRTTRVNGALRAVQTYIKENSTRLF